MPSEFSGKLKGGAGWCLYRGEVLDAVCLRYDSLTQASFAAYLEALEQHFRSLIKGQRKRAVLLEFEGNGLFFNASRRRQVARVIADNQHTLVETTAGIVLVPRSTLARGVLLAIHWAAGDPLESKIAGSIEAGFDMLAEICPDLDRDNALAQYTAAKDKALIRYG